MFFCRNNKFFDSSWLVSVFVPIFLVACSSAPPLPQVQYGKKQPINNPEWVKERQSLFNQEVAIRAAKAPVPQTEQEEIYKANSSAASIESSALEVPLHFSEKSGEANDLIEAAKNGKPVEPVVVKPKKHKRAVNVKK